MAKKGLDELRGDESFRITERVAIEIRYDGIDRSTKPQQIGIPIVTDVNG